eukprot:9030300-Pyramimonas_sp.AAC.1
MCSSETAWLVAVACCHPSSPRAHGTFINIPYFISICKILLAMAVLFFLYPTLLLSISGDRG